MVTITATMSIFTMYEILTPILLTGFSINNVSFEVIARKRQKKLSILTVPQNSNREIERFLCSGI